MKKILILLAWVSAMKSYAQNYDADASANQLRYTIYSTQYKEGKERIELFIRQKQLIVIDQSETKNSHFFKFMAGQEQVSAIDSLCNKLGYVSSKNLNSYNNEVRLAQTRLELERLENKKSEYEKMLSKMDSVKAPGYYQHWEKIGQIDSEIYTAKKTINSLQSVKDMYSVSISLNDEQSSPSNTKVTFVHMPGMEYSYLFVDNPRAGLSAVNYQGASLRYLFTKGKSYFSLGAMKADRVPDSDSLMYSELFNFTFGQDWYNRHFGHGDNKFFNLYVGYQAGFTIAYNEKYAKGIPFVSPGMGVELFKNKLFLVDSGLNYYLPLTSENRYLRGLSVKAALNFSF